MGMKERTATQVAIYEEQKQFTKDANNAQLWIAKSILQAVAGQMYIRGDSLRGDVENLVFAVQEVMEKRNAAFKAWEQRNATPIPGQPQS
jgi:hypothetical protein